MIMPERARGIILLGAAAALALAPTPSRGQEAAKAKTVELREYQGEKLDPIGRFSENSIIGPRRVDIKAYRLKVGGLVDRPMSLTYDEVLARPSKSRVIVIHCVEGWAVKVLWEGVPLAALIDAAGAKPSANTVIFRSADGYSSSLPLAYIRQKDILLAFKMNGLTMPEERGFPFEVAAEGKWGYKWAKWVETIELSDNPDFRGYWESRGFNNNGDLSGPRFEKR
ncbi:MAG TPA: oxidoreductase [Candidatus Aminicenantes bacterium]|nr:molybdopterin-dependent oxidoreductase [Candidatus Aminicenantes bacterium]HDT14062.1 oxidoreductase [Candidatus Aminicenantes bacterium]